jgi:LEA14-like dessication related protein
MKKRPYLALLFVLALAVSCKKPQAFEYRGVKNFKISNWGFNKTAVQMDLVYFNPNNFGVDLKKVDCEIFIDKNYLGKFVLDTTMHIDKKSEFGLPSTIEVDMKKVFKNTLNVLMNKEVLVTVKGSTKVGKAGIFVTVPVNYESVHSFSLFK